MIKFLILFSLVLTLTVGATFDHQEAFGINKIKGYVSSGGTTVEVEIENGTATTTTPETEPEPEESEEQSEEQSEEKDDDFEEGQETATKAGQTIKETVSKTVKETAKDVNDKIEEEVEEAVEEVCKSTACMLKKRHQAEIEAWEKEQAEKGIEKEVDEETGEEIVCDNTACLMEQKQRAEQEALGIFTDCRTTECLKEQLLGEEKKVTKPKYDQKIITLTLSNSCLQAHKNNVTTICPTYEDLLQFDNTNHDISGAFYHDENGFFQRGEAKMDKHCMFYLPEMFPIVMVVDPDSCWERQRGGYTITINAIKTEDFKFKLVNEFDYNELRDIQKRETHLLNSEQQLKDEIDRLEDIFEARDDDLEDLDEKLADFDKETRELYEEVGQNPDTVKIREDERKELVKSLNNRSLDRQLRSYNSELLEARLNYAGVVEEINELSDKKRLIKGESSLSSVNGTIAFGVGRSFEECRDAKVGSDMQMISDTINYMLKNCEGDPDNVVIEHIEQTPITDLLEFTEYRYKAWFEQISKDCLGLCKEY